MFYDLNVLWDANDQDLSRTVSFLDELGYNVIGLSHTISGKLPAEIFCPIPKNLFPNGPKKLRYLRRCTLIFSDPSSNHRLPTLANAYDLVAVRPTSEKAFQQACLSLAHVSLISLDLTQRLGYHFKPKLITTAIARGLRFELCYSPGIISIDSAARRNLISNATQLIRASRGRGLILSSEASKAIGIRAPIDVVNLAAVWGLKQEKARNAIDLEARGVVARADFSKSSYRGVIDVVNGGQPPNTLKDSATNGKGQANGLKRKAEEAETPEAVEPKVSKREMKRRAKQAKLKENGGMTEVSAEKDSTASKKA